MSPITEFYSGRSIFITGGTGFMGKVLLEKIIRSLPQINKVYILLRPKKGLTPSERLDDLISKLPFTLLDINPQSFRKLVPINGDTNVENLGLSEEDKIILVNEVSVVFHMAASVRMDLTLKQAIIQNTLATQRLLNICTEMKKLVAVLHLSTAYCNVDIQIMNEEIYLPDVDPYKITDLVQWMDEKTLECLKDTFMGVHPNTYTYSKRLAEIIAWDMGKKLPVVIGRPSIVTPSLREPAEGWVDNYNGPVGILTSAGKGIIRSAVADSKVVPQLVPVDIAINSLIVCAWLRATNKFTETPIYNITQSDIAQLTWGNLFDKFRKLVKEYPYKRFIWCPVADVTTHIWLHKIIVVIFHMIPAYFIDFLLTVFMQKPFLVQVQKRLNTGMELLSYFTTRQWTFSNNKLLEARDVLTPEDRESFYIFDNVDMDSYLENSYFGSRKYCVHEDWDNLSIQRIVYKIMFAIDYMGRILLVYGLLWFIMYIFDSSNMLSWSYWMNSTGLGSTKIH